MVSGYTSKKPSPVFQRKGGGGGLGDSLELDGLRKTHQMHHEGSLEIFDGCFKNKLVPLVLLCLVGYPSKVAFPPLLKNQKGTNEGR